jgi:hypothetical protein
LALTVNFSTSQTPGSPGDIIFTDTSTGSDGSVTQRRIYIQSAAGDYLVESGTSTQYEVWSGFPGTTTITLEDILEQDTAARVVVQWLDVSNNVLYDKTQYIGFTAYNEDFDYELTQNVAANPLLVDDNNFWQNKLKLRTDIESGNNAIERASDIAAAQQCYDRATYLRNNSQYLFNANA